MRRTVMTLLLSLASLTVLTVAPASAAPNPVDATPKKLAFGDVPTGQSVTMYVTFTNNGSTGLYFSGWAICPCTEPPTPSAFEFDSAFLANNAASCSNLDSLLLPAGGSCDTAIIFLPTNPDSYHAVLIVLFGVSEGQQTYTVDVKLSGKGS